MAQTIDEATHPTIDSEQWPEVALPPTAEELPYDDGQPMESPWHAENAHLLKAAYIAAQGGRREGSYVGINMFVYYSLQQICNQDYKGLDVFIVKDVDGTRHRLSWVIWEEGGRYPDVIVELLSPSTQANDLGEKKRLYEQVFRTTEYFCIAPQVERLLGWRLESSGYRAIEPDKRGWLWSQELQLWLGAWQGAVLGEEHTWARFYGPDGELVLLPDEAEKLRADAAEQQAEAEKLRADAAEQRASEMAARLAALEAQLQQLQSGAPNDDKA